MANTTWHLTTYGKIISTSAYIAPRTVYPRDTGAELVKKDGRPTEWAAVFLQRFGYLPGWLGVQDTYWTLPRKIRAIRVDWEYVGKKLQPDRVESRRQCCACGQWKDLTSEHWHRNPNGRNGWHSKCKECRNDESMDYMEVKRAA